MTDPIGIIGLRDLLVNLELECAELERPDCPVKARLATLHRRERDVRQVRTALLDLVRERGL